MSFSYAPIPVLQFTKLAVSQKDTRLHYQDILTYIDTISSEGISALRIAESCAR